MSLTNQDLQDQYVTPAQWLSCSPAPDLPHHPREDQAKQHIWEQLATFQLCTDDPDYMR